MSRELYYKLVDINGIPSTFCKNAQPVLISMLLETYIQKDAILTV